MMCLPIRKQDPKTRRRMVVANLALVVGLVLWALVRPSLAAPHAWIDGLAGFFLGISIGANLFVVVRSRACRQGRVAP